MGLVKKWSDEDVEYLEETWGKFSVGTICSKLGRSKADIRNKVDELGLGKFLDNGDYITFAQLINQFSTNSYSRWVDKFEKHGFPFKFKTINKLKVKVVYIEDFWKWAEQNKSLLDFSKLEENSLGKEPDWVKFQRKIDYQKRSNIKISMWTYAEDSKLRILLKQNKYTLGDLSKKLQRTCSAIERRISDLNIVERPLRSNINPYSKEDFEKKKT